MQEEKVKAEDLQAEEVVKDEETPAKVQAENLEASEDAAKDTKKEKKKKDKTAELSAIIDELKSSLAAKDEEVKKINDMMLRRQADFENYKRRMAKKEEDYKKLLIKDFAQEVININDDLLRAVEAAENIEEEKLAEGHESFVNGVSMISDRIEGTLEKFGVVEVNSIDQEFDPMFNEAVEITTSDEVESDTITKVYQKGFKLDDYVIRSAKVRVTKPAN